MSFLAVSTVFNLADKLAAGGIDIVAAGFAGGGIKTSLHEDIAKIINGCFAGTLVIRVWEGIKGDQV